MTQITPEQVEDAFSMLWRPGVRESEDVLRSYISQLEAQSGVNHDFRQPVSDEKLRGRDAYPYSL